MLESLTMLKPILLCCILASLVAVTFACGGCVVKKVDVKPCPGMEKSNVVIAKVNSINLRSDCTVKPDGSLNITKNVRVIQMKWQAQKGIIKKSGESDGCKDLEKSSKDKDSGGMIRLLGLPDKCPVEKGFRKVNKELNVSKYKDKIQLLHGPASGKVDVTHDKGRTCYTFDALIDCKGGSG